MRVLCLTTSLLLCVAFCLEALLPNLSELSTKNLNIRLQEPEYHDGVLSTTKGGIVEGTNMYLQAKTIRYVHRKKHEKEENFIEASGDLLFRLNKQTYTGERLVYHIDTQTCQIIDGHTQSKQWYVGGKQIDLQSDGSGVVYDAYLTTTEQKEDEWALRARQVQLDADGKVHAEHVTFLIESLPVFWIPRFTHDLNESYSSKLKYRFQYRLGKGAIAGLFFKCIDTKTWKAELLFDVGLNKFFRPRGFGGGLKTRYTSLDKKETFSALTYFAQDIRLLNEDVDTQTRYIAQAKYANTFFDDTVDCKINFDKQSDQYVTRDYIERGLNLSRVGKTEATFSRKETDWIALLNTRMKVNKFQNVKQELPLFTLNMRPMNIGSTSWVLANRFSAGYLDFSYREKVRKWSGVDNFRSGRMELGQQLYRPLLVPKVSITPQIGYTVIGYSTSPQNNAKLLALANAGVECHTRFVRTFTHWHTAVEPYAHYEYLTFPTVDPHKHYIFDLEDGYYRLNTLRFGLRNFFTRNAVRDFQNRLNLDLYTRAFFHTPTIYQPIPKIYLDGSWKALSWMSYTLSSAWDLERNIMDHFNLRGDLTISEDIALALEYRKRSPFSWRKVDSKNFIIDSFISEKRLRHSALSDRRDTLLAHLYCKLSADMGVELLTHHGWNRRGERRYTEYEARLNTLVQGTVNLAIGISHLIGQGIKYSLELSMGATAPSTSRKISRIGQVNYE